MLSSRSFTVARVLVAVSGVATLAAVSVAGCASGLSEPQSYGTVVSPEGGREGSAADAPSAPSDVTVPNEGSPTSTPPEAAPPDATGDAPPTPSDASDSGPAVPDATPVSDASDASNVGPADAAIDVVDSASPVDAAPDASSDAGCTGSTIAIISGNTQTSFGTSWSNGAWATPVTLTTGMNEMPSLVAYGTGFRGVLNGTPSALLALSSTATGWTTASPVGVATTNDATALTVLGGKLEAFYKTGTVPAAQHWRVEFDGAAWGAPEDIKVPLGDGGYDRSFGPRNPVAVARGSELDLLFSGDNEGLYAQLWAGSWQRAVGVPNAGTNKFLSPAAVAFSSGPIELLVVYIDKKVFPDTTTNHLMYSTRSGGNWANAAEVYNVGGNAAFSNDPVALTTLSGGRAVAVYRGSDKKMYSTIFDPGASTKWSTPVSVVPSASALTLPKQPAIAPGTCGSDAVVVYADSTGATAADPGVVKMVRLTGTSWSAPEVVPGVAPALFVAVATQ